MSDDEAAAHTAECKEVLVLRSFSSIATRQRAVRRLLAKYVDGRRTAAHVVDGLAALAAQLHYADASRLAADAMHGVRPVPTVLWDWVCAHLDWLTCDAQRQVLRLAAADARLRRRLHPHRERLVASVDGVLALLHERRRFEWADDFLRRALVLGAWGPGES